MQLIDGKALAAKIRADVKMEISKNQLHPTLAVLLVGDDEASHIYVNLKEKAAHEAGIKTDIRRLPSSTSDDELQSIIQAWNADSSVHAILIQVPLPPGHNTDGLIATMDPRKDVDGFHPGNITKLLEGTATLFPPVHEGILRLIGATPVQMKQAHVVILANSDTFSKPLERLLQTSGSFVTTFFPEHLDRTVIQNADIIIVAVGRPGFVTRDMIKSGACIIDVGTNRQANGTVVGDVDTEHIMDILGWLSPVPGGVGPMTVALLLKNTLELAKKHKTHT